MKHTLVLFSKVVTVMFELFILGALIKLPQTEGRAAGLDLISIYRDPFIIYGYIASIPFFFGLYQGFKLLGFLEKKKTKSSVRALRNIRNCAVLLIGFIIGAGIFVKMNAQNDDPAGFFALCILAIGASGIVAISSHFMAEKLSRGK